MGRGSGKRRLLRAGLQIERDIGDGCDQLIRQADVVEGDAIDIAEQRGRDERWRFDRPDVSEGDVADGGVGLLDLDE